MNNLKKSVPVAVNPELKIPTSINLCLFKIKQMLCLILLNRQIIYLKYFDKL